MTGSGDRPTARPPENGTAGVREPGPSTARPTENGTAAISEPVGAIIEPPSLQARTGSSGWTVRCAQGISRLNASARAAEEVRLTAAEEAHLSAANQALRRGTTLLDQFTSMPLIPRLLRSSATYVAVLAELQTATEQLLYLQDDDALFSMIPDLAGAVRNYLAADDQRRETYLTSLACLQAGTSPPARAT